MNKMKRVTCAALAGILTLGMCSCGKKSDEGKKTESTTSIVETTAEVTTIGEVKDRETRQFGTYEGKPIEWIVLDSKDGKTLLLSKNVLCRGIYQEEFQLLTTWEKCTIRTWLNGGFLNMAFAADEQEKILLTSIITEEYADYEGNMIGGNPTEDKVFLLSEEEAKKYFLSDTDRIAEWPEEGWTGNPGFPWILRTACMGAGGAGVKKVSGDGLIYDGDGLAQDGIRPAIWVQE